MNPEEIIEWIEDLVADYGEITSEMMDDLVKADILSTGTAEQIYDAYCRGV